MDPGDKHRDDDGEIGAAVEIPSRSAPRRVTLW
jgi:hypothetical protein